MDIEQLKQEVAKIPAESPTRPLWTGLVEELERLGRKTPGASSQEVATLRQELAAFKSQVAEQAQHPEHIKGLCTAPSCERGCATVEQEQFIKARVQVGHAVNTALHWFGPEGDKAIAVLEQALEEWNAAGKPEATVRVTPAAKTVIVTG